MLKKVIKAAFSIKGDMADYDEIERRIMEGGEVHGTNLCILVTAILIASIGLNMDSTAVIIGAMLISPLMGSIMAISYDFVTGNFLSAEQHIIGFFFQIIASLLTSTIYFHFSPITAVTSELMARTNPTIWDVLIATCGGLAGAIGTTRKEKSNVLPGVAIATALMPPLCTAGYGIATTQWKYVAGALTLFIFNTWFIMLTTVVVLLILQVPSRESPNPIAVKRIKRKAVTITTLLLIVGVMMGIRMVYESKQDKNSALASSTDSNVSDIMKEAEIIWPQIEKMQVGKMGSTTHDGSKETSKIVAIVYLSDKLEGKDLLLFEKWMETTENIDEFLYETARPQTEGENQDVISDQ